MWSRSPAVDPSLKNFRAPLNKAVFPRRAHLKNLLLLENKKKTTQYIGLWTVIIFSFGRGVKSEDGTSIFGYRSTAFLTDNTNVYNRSISHFVDICRRQIWGETSLGGSTPSCRTFAEAKTLKICKIFFNRCLRSSNKCCPFRTVQGVSPR